jgi:hypothetical protein
VDLYEASQRLLAVLCVPPALCQGQKLPATIYTTGQGLAHNSVQKGRARFARVHLIWHVLSDDDRGRLHHCLSQPLGSQDAGVVIPPAEVWAVEPADVSFTG